MILPGVDLRLIVDLSFWVECLTWGSPFIFAMFFPFLELRMLQSLIVVSVSVGSLRLFVSVIVSVGVGPKEEC